MQTNSIRSTSTYVAPSNTETFRNDNVCILPLMYGSTGRQQTIANIAVHMRYGVQNDNASEKPPVYAEGVNILPMYENATESESALKITNPIITANVV